MPNGTGTRHRARWQPNPTTAGDPPRPGEEDADMPRIHVLKRQQNQKVSAQPTAMTSAGDRRHPGTRASGLVYGWVLAGSETVRGERCIDRASHHRCGSWGAGVCGLVGAVRASRGSHEVVGMRISTAARTRRSPADTAATNAGPIEGCRDSPLVDAAATVGSRPPVTVPDAIEARRGGWNSTGTCLPRGRTSVGTIFDLAPPTAGNVHSPGRMRS